MKRCDLTVERNRLGLTEEQEMNNYRRISKSLNNKCITICERVSFVWKQLTFVDVKELVRYSVKKMFKT